MVCFARNICISQQQACDLRIGTKCLKPCIVQMEEVEEDIPVVVMEQTEENTPDVKMKQVVQSALDEDASGTQESSAMKDLKFLENMWGFIKKDKSTHSKNLLPLQVQVEDLLQRKRTLKVKKIWHCSIYIYPISCFAIG